MKNRAPRDRRAPKVYSDIIDFACDLDRTFFANNRSSRSYVRCYVPGELWPHDAHVDHALAEYVERTEDASLLVAVTAIGPEQRVRQPLFDVAALDRLGATHRSSA